MSHDDMQRKFMTNSAKGLPEPQFAKIPNTVQVIGMPPKRVMAFVQKWEWHEAQRNIVINMRVT